jgi:hypothetical protein
VNFFDLFDVAADAVRRPHLRFSAAFGIGAALAREATHAPAF